MSTIINYSRSEINQDASLREVAMERVGSEMSFDLIRNTLDQWQALAVLRLAFPKLVRYGELVFLAENASDKSIEAFQSRGVQGTDLERVINHIHLWDILKDFEANGDAYSGIMEILTISWTAWIPRCTDRLVSVQCSCDPEDYGPTITFTTSPS